MIRLFFSFVICALLVVINPISFRGPIDTFGNQLFYSYTAFTYRDGVPRPDVVVLFDRDLERMGATWPADSSVHASVIRRAKSLGYERVFVDFVFLDDRSHDDFRAMENAFKLASPDFGIFISQYSGTRRAFPAFEALVDQNEFVEFVDVRTEFREGTFVVSPNEGEARTPTAAFRLAAHYSSGKSPQQKDIEIQWGAPSHTWHGTNSSQNIFQKLLFDVVTSVSGDWAPSQVSRLSADGEGFFRRPAVMQFFNKDFKIAESKTLFYGGNFRAIEDVAPVPHYGFVPGVEVHAMAFHNLINSEATANIRASNFTRTNTYQILVLFCVHVLIASFVLAWRFKKADHSLYSVARAKFESPVALLLIFLIILVQVFVMKFGPGAALSTVLAYAVSTNIAPFLSKRFEEMK